MATAGLKPSSLACLETAGLGVAAFIKMFGYHFLLLEGVINSVSICEVISSFGLLRGYGLRCLCTDKHFYYDF